MHWQQKIALASCTKAFFDQSQYINTTTSNTTISLWAKCSKFVVNHHLERIAFKPKDRSTLISC